VSREGSDERKIMDLRPLHPIGNFFDVSPQDQYRVGAIPAESMNYGSPICLLLDSAPRDRRTCPPRLATTAASP